MTFLNKIILTFTTENIEAYQWTDRIETKHGKIFDTMKDLIKFYTNEEKRRKNILRKEKAKKHWSRWRENVRDMVKKLTEEKRRPISKNWKSQLTEEPNISYKKAVNTLKSKVRF